MNARTPPRAGPLLALALAALCLAASGCYSRFAAFAAMPFLYRKVELPAERVMLDLPYRSDAEADPEKHRLDLFLPEAGEGAGAPGAVKAAWPVLVFVHGGGWTSGDRSLRAGGRDVYRNIGRFFASHGVGAAVVSYRLQFEFTWQDQVEDVARAVAWVHENVAGYGGNPDAIFVSGHSAGAQLAAWVALDRELAARHGAPAVCGLIPVSGAGFDLADRQTYQMGASFPYYERRFRNGDPGDAWLREASPLSHLNGDVPAALVLVAEDDWRSLHHQARLLHNALRRAGAPSQLVQVPGEDHYTVVLTLSRDDKTSAPAMLEFIRKQEGGCGAVRRGRRASRG
jgi:acetyl esterase/lipase